jgi:hypothetical protein
MRDELAASSKLRRPVYTPILPDRPDRAGVSLTFAIPVTAGHCFNRAHAQQSCWALIPAGGNQGVTSVGPSLWDWQSWPPELVTLQRTTVNRRRHHIPADVFSSGGCTTFLRKGYLASNSKGEGATMTRSGAPRKHRECGDSNRPSYGAARWPVRRVGSW